MLYAAFLLAVDLCQVVSCASSNVTRNFFDLPLSALNARVISKYPKINIPKGINSIGEKPVFTSCLICRSPLKSIPTHISPTTPNQKEMNIKTKVTGRILIFICVCPANIEMSPLIIGRNEFL